jgi:hypothetical protein
LKRCSGDLANFQSPGKIPMIGDINGPDSAKWGRT